MATSAIVHTYLMRRLFDKAFAVYLNFQKILRLKIMKAVVTGASGHVGINLIRTLLARGTAVRAFTHLHDRGLSNLDIELVTGDVCDPDSLIKALQGADVVYHLAAHISLLMSDWTRCEKINVEGTRNVIKACFHNKIKRLVHFSSIHALQSEPHSTPVDESRPFVDSPRCPPYDRSKAEGEKIVRRAVESGLNAVIINPTGIIGPYDYYPSHFGEALIQFASAKIPLLIGGGFDWVDARDVAEAAIRAQEHAPAGSNYLISGHWLSVKETAELTAEIMGIKAPSLVCPIAVARIGAPFVTAFSQATGKRPLFTTASLKALASNRSISHAKATRELGYQPRPIRETFADTLQWFKENGYLK